MKKIILFLLLTVSTNVFAEWTEVDRSKDGDITSYADFGTIKKKGNKVKMWGLYDSKKVRKFENYRYLSSLTRFEYDCEEETVKDLDIYWYSGNMRQGEIVLSTTNIKNEATSILPMSIYEGLFKIACGKK